MPETTWQENAVEIDGATVRYRSRGEGPPVVFVHGVYVSGAVWDGLADRLEGLRCIVPTWPLGAHRDPAPEADLSARAMARRIPALLDALDLTEVTLVGNDTGGGLCLAALGTEHPGLDRVGRLALTNCDSYEHFPPKGFDRIVTLCRRAPKTGASVLRFLSSAPGRRFFLRSVCATPPTGDAARRIFGAFPESPEARADALRTTQSLEPSVTLDAVDALRAFTRPVLLVWGDRDKLFPVEHAHRLRDDFADARLEVIAGASTYVMVDRPAEVAALLSPFAAGA